MSIMFYWLVFRCWDKRGSILIDLNKYLFYDVRKSKFDIVLVLDLFWEACACMHCLDSH